KIERTLKRMSGIILSLRARRFAEEQNWNIWLSCGVKIWTSFRMLRLGLGAMGMKQLAFSPLLAVTLSLYASLLRSHSREFEVACIKPTKLVGVGVKSACHGVDSRFASRDLAATVPLGRCVISSGRLSHMIGVAYNVTMDVLEGGPQWVKDG